MGNFVNNLNKLNNEIIKNNRTGAIVDRYLLSVHTGINDPQLLSNDLYYNRNKLNRAKRGMYIIGDVNNDIIANRIYEPSYISLETVLSRGSIIPEYITTITSVTLKNGTVFTNNNGRFEYRHINKNLFFGYFINKEKGIIAYLEKALLDYIYLNGDLFETNQKIYNAIDKFNIVYLEKNIFLNFQSIRFQNLDKLSWTKLNTFSNRMGKIKLNYIIKALKLYEKSYMYGFHK